jgi:predicted 3-demethylubiquinone-9 3-methyltransferase (glyoxalase superfamily)
VFAREVDGSIPSRSTKPFLQTADSGLDDYGFSRRFGCVTDRFDVSWQLNPA